MSNQHTALDKFAGQAAQTLLAAWLEEAANEGGPLVDSYVNHEWIAEQAYDMAEAMLVEKNRRVAKEDAL